VIVCSELHDDDLLG